MSPLTYCTSLHTRNCQKRERPLTDWALIQRTNTHPLRDGGVRLAESEVGSVPDSVVSLHSEALASCFGGTETIPKSLLPDANSCLEVIRDFGLDHSVGDLTREILNVRLFGLLLAPSPPSQNNAPSRRLCLLDRF